MKKSDVWRKVWISFFWLAGIAGISLLIYQTFEPWSYDDPFITYRYAENIRNGVGFVYNASEPILSTTTPFFALLLAFLGFFWNDIPHLALAVGSISIAVSMALLCDIGGGRKTILIACAGLLFYPLFPHTLLPLTSETPLYIALGLGCISAYQHRRYLLASTLAGLLVLTRPDGILLPALVGLHFLIFRLKEGIPWKALLPFTLILLPWVVFSWNFFGSPLPITLGAKQMQGEMQISKPFSVGFLELASGYLSHPYYLLMAVFAGAGILYLLFKHPEGLLVPIWAAAYHGAYTYLGVSAYFWYFAPIIPGIAILSGMGFQILPDLAEKLKLARWTKITLSVFLLAGILIITAGQLGDVLPMRGQSDSRIQIYTAAGEWLDAHAPADASVGALEVGALGFTAHRRMIDFAGLIQPAVSQQMKSQSTYQDTALWVVETYQPDIIVLMRHSFPTLESRLLEQSCSIVKQFEAGDYNAKVSLDVYFCIR